MEKVRERKKNEMLHEYLDLLHDKINEIVEFINAVTANDTAIDQEIDGEWRR